MSEPRQRCVDRGPRIIEAISSPLVRTSAGSLSRNLRFILRDWWFFSSQPMLLSPKFPAIHQQLHSTDQFVYVWEESEMGYFKSLSFPMHWPGHCSARQSLAQQAVLTLEPIALLWLCPVLNVLSCVPETPGFQKMAGNPSKQHFDTEGLEFVCLQLGSFYILCPSQAPHAAPGCGAHQ